MLVEPDYRCGTCRRGFRYAEELDIHVRVHRERPARSRSAGIGIDIDMSRHLVLPPGARLAPVICRWCGARWLQAICDPFPLDGPDPPSCTDCHRKGGISERHPTEEEEKFFQSVPPGFLARHLQVILAVQAVEHRKHFPMADYRGEGER